MRTAAALAVVCSVGVALRPVTPPRVRARARVRVAPDAPELPPATEDGGVLSRILPLSLLLETQEADRSADLRVGEDGKTFQDSITLDMDEVPNTCQFLSLVWSGIGRAQWRLSLIHI